MARRSRTAAALCAALALGCAAPFGGSGGVGGGGRSAPAVPAEAETLDGLVRLHRVADEGRLLLEVPPEDEELLYLVSLPRGLGSNAVGLDRGQLGESRVVRFVRAGAKVLLVAPNLEWRSSAEREVERRAVRESFAESVLWAFEVAGERDGRAVVDATDFLVRDAHGIARRLADAGQGEFALDDARSALAPDGVRAFPDNVAVEALLTFTAERPGPEVVATTPDPRAVSVRVRHHLVRLPEAGSFRPRPHDPRCGYFARSWRDLSAPIDRSTLRQAIVRHRLEPGEPIVYHVDSAAPEPVRTALLEGARFWEDAFAAAGLAGAFRVELLPEDADPLDLGYHVVQWVHRSTRGWSYGDTLVDPRTGEVLKGHVTLGALRVRQDVLLAEGLLAPYADGDRDERVRDMALARLRQLAAHEVGHTLGLRHAFAASAFGRASVMDYPPPRVRIADDGSLDLSEAYADGCGAWDALAIRYGYAPLPEGREQETLAAWLAEMEAALPLLSDADARGPGRAHPLASLWDDGADPVDALHHALEVRRIALGRLGPAALRPGEPMARLEEVLVPVYLHHRYQLEAAVRLLGGVAYRHAVRGGLPPEVAPVPAAEQRRALDAVRRALVPETLALPAELLALVPPPPPGADPAAERFSDGERLLDPARAAATAAALALELVLHPDRAARLVDQRRADPGQLGLAEVVDALVGDAWSSAEDPGEVRAQLLDRLMDLADREDVAPRVQRVALAAVHGVARRLDASEADEASDEERRRALWERRRIRHFLEDPLAERPAPRPLPAPPGPPIGAGGGATGGASADPPGSPLGGAAAGAVNGAAAGGFGGAFGRSARGAATAVERPACDGGGLHLP